MKYRTVFSNFSKRDRKTLYIILSIVIVSVLALTVVYAALSRTLNINGNAEVTAASWDIYLDNIQLNSRSATKTVPTITDKTTTSFSTTLSKPGDFYEFTIDVVNNGTIDAMIDSVTKTPELTDTQKKYLNYIVEYQNGESIATKQLVSKKSFVRLKVKVEFRKDISASDLPKQSETLNLSFKVNYVQSDDNNENVSIDNNGNLIKIVSGNYDTVGSEICIGDECFYVITSDDDSVTMLAKYNLYVGNECSSTAASSCKPYGDEITGVQDSTMIGYGTIPIKGPTIYSSLNYWHSEKLKEKYGTSYPAYVYDSNSVIYNYVESYKMYLESQGVIIEEARLIKIEEIEMLECSISDYSGSCTSASTWVYKTSYWTGTAHSTIGVFVILSTGEINSFKYNDPDSLGVRPVIKILKSQI